MSPKDFFSRWGVGLKDYAKSPIGVAHTQIIISWFIVVGLFLGSLDMRGRGESLVAFILFAFGCLQLLSVWGLYKQYRLLLSQKRLLGGFKNV
jgi:hypothetical protein